MPRTHTFRVCALKSEISIRTRIQSNRNPISADVFNLTFDPGKWGNKFAHPISRLEIYVRNFHYNYRLQCDL